MLDCLWGKVYLYKAEARSKKLTQKWEFSELLNADIEKI
uniref:Uncharacterized protein n=1 Tax=Polynucleobacter necessarius subsp. necessarius (strain STIR1) TaxID=452638 RepID=B1XT52_POLNS